MMYNDKTIYRKTKTKLKMGPDPDHVTTLSAQLFFAPLPLAVVVALPLAAA